MPTIYFSHCWGVFEGGGVRASAHAGAYSAARKAGVSFGRVAGTSGGSIVAALVAAGAEADYISQLLREMSFPSFLAPPAPSLFQRKRWLRLARFFTRGQWRDVIDIALDSGLHSSSQIEIWMESQLVKILGGRNSSKAVAPITFNQLRLPLHIVATDLVTGQPKVWSKETTPDDSVALAVRCSCTIPFFFQSVPSGTSLLIDGGVVSNLPTYVFSPLSENGVDRSILSRILAFRLFENNDASGKPEGILDFLKLLANTVISSATHIQSALQPDAYVVSIATGKIKSTDFAIGLPEKELLHRAGECAVDEFLRRERAIIRTNSLERPFQGFDEKIFLMMQSLRLCSKTFCSVGISTYWFEFSFPTMLAAARRGVHLVCVTTASSDKGERRRRSLLRKLGAEIIEVPGPDDLLIDGFLFDLPSDQGRAVMSNFRGQINTDTDYLSGTVRVYTYSLDMVILDILFHKIKKFIRPKEIAPKQFPYVECSKAELFGLLRTIPHYKDAKLSVRQLKVSNDICVLQRTVKEYKVLQIGKHIDDLLSGDCELFDLRKVAFDDGTFSIVVPPILEELDEQLIVIDGNARLFHCLAHGIDTIAVVVVSGVTAPLPAANPQSITSLSLASTTKTLRTNYQNLDESLFRRIDAAVHHHPWDAENARNAESADLGRAL